jgi:hypothetical protein
MAWHWDSSSSGVATTTKTAQVAIPVLTGGVDLSVAHTLVGCTKFNFIIRSSTNQVLVNKCYIDPALPTSNFIIGSPVDIPAGTLWAIITGFN